MTNEAIFTLIALASISVIFLFALTLLQYLEYRRKVMELSDIRDAAYKEAYEIRESAYGEAKDIREKSYQEAREIRANVPLEANESNSDSKYSQTTRETTHFELHLHSYDMQESVILKQLEQLVDEYVTQTPLIPSQTSQSIQSGNSVRFSANYPKNLSEN